MLMETGKSYISKCVFCYKLVKILVTHTTVHTYKFKIIYSVCGCMHDDVLTQGGNRSDNAYPAVIKLK